MADSGGNKAIMAALGANLGIAVLKFGAFLLTKSSSMLAESIHSVADTGNQLLLLVGGKASRKKADDEHQFGHGQNRYIYAFLVSIVMFSLGGLFSLYEAWEKWHDPHGIDSWAWVPIVVLVGSILLEGRSFLVANKQAQEKRGRRSWLGYLREAKSPELPVVMLEDSAAVAGLFFALIGVVVTVITGDGRWDAAGSAAIGVLLVVVAIFLAVEIKSLLVGESASPETDRRIREAIKSEAGIGLIHLKTMHLGPEELLVAAKISVEGDVSAIQLVEAINATEARIRQAVSQAQMVYIEPDIYREDYTSSKPTPESEEEL
ncbi:cation diffusion facilitator family transporter [Kocuria sp. HSID16901]|uniref:cation diffusion facilitator family transporter n=1 Tax=Kocuria sp. HSID16901 TaxID=2419505 RepID=UPI0006600A46|nr:cation diffusion facilitator family transporter [Kocuria sp. HSID16901]MCT1367915.1 cation diffusion facilitator family transporter [Rothia sp. p3-SID1597]RUQ21098.1 cation diffusion facilitator family transporter [Kocuria sp. HSID16901]